MLVVVWPFLSLLSKIQHMGEPNNMLQDDIDDQTLKKRSQEAIDHLVELKINFLALDFDLTILNFHTGGRWSGSIDELAQGIRPVFIHLINAAHDAGIFIAVVTFSPQVGHIARAMEKAFPHIHEHIVIRGRDRTWHYEGNGMTAGKQPFMASAVEELTRKASTEIEIRRCSTVLIDDDPDNIRIALNDRVRGILYNPRSSESHLLDIILGMS